MGSEVAPEAFRNLVWILLMAALILVLWASQR
jgi:hypothetical protein